jgi:hypothetical protein
MLIAEFGALPIEGDVVTIDLPVDPADLVDDEPVRRRLVVDVLRVERHVPTEVRVRLVIVPKAEDVQRWMEEMRYYVGLGIFDPSMLLRLQVQHLEYSLGLVINEVLLQDAERTAIDMAEFALSE